LRRGGVTTKRNHGQYNEGAQPPTTMQRLY
jgi:hypothetical protein